MSFAERTGPAARRRYGGTTLVELLVAMAMFCLIMLFGISFSVVGQRSFERAKAIRFATTFGSGLMERYLTLSWDRLVSATATAVGPGNVTYTCTTNVATNTVGATAVKYVSSAVTWPGQQVPVEFETVVSSPVVN